MKARAVGALLVGAGLVVTVAPSGAGAQGDPSDLSEVPDAVTLESEHHLTPVLDGDSKYVSVIIKTETEPVASYDGDIPGLEATNPKTTGENKLDVDDPAVQEYEEFVADENEEFADALEAAIPEAEVTQTFELVLGGVSAVVPRDQVEEIADVEGVEAVYLDELQRLDTEVSPDFIGATQLWADLGGTTAAGEGVIVANVDSGIWPEHPSVSDPDPSGTPYPAPPSYWNGTGTGAGCDFGDLAFNPDDVAFTCNNKLLGAYNFTNTYTAIIGLLPTEFNSARDSNGHGTHTLTTAAGNGDVAASIYGIPRGAVSGIAPRAHVVAYKGCGVLGCFGSDTMAAIQQAVADGVDVINYSISGGNSPYSDATSLAMLDAWNAGTLVVPSAGNSGPGADTVAHREPWSLTVGASTTDRHFLSTVDLVADNGDTLSLEGATVTPGITTATPVIYAPGGSGDLCLTPFAPGTFNGEIVICQRGAIARVAKSFNVAAGGAGGLLLYNPVQQGLNTDNHFLPSLHLDGNDGAQLVAFMDGHTGVKGTFVKGQSRAVQGDVMASFSSRGGPGQTLGVSKPDVTAPGVQILAGHTPLPEDQNGGLPGQLFQAIQGTSMSAPHVAGAVALVRDANPDWSAGEIKSALMMTATTAGVTKEDGVTPADAFDHGSGRIDPTAAARAALTISAPGSDFLDMEDHLWDANTPSVYVPDLAGEITVERTLRDQIGRSGVWKTTVDSPTDLDVKVPKNIFVRRNGEKTFKITVDARHVPDGEVRMATISLERRAQNGSGQALHIPVTIVKGEQPVSIDKTCAPGEINRKDTTTCTITVSNNSFDDADVAVKDRLPKQLKLDRKSVTDGATTTPKTVQYEGTLAGAAAPSPDVAVDPLASPFGYVPLAGFGGTTDVGATDESIANFNVPPFEYAGEIYSQIGIVSNGYVVVGGGTGADVDFINSDLPDANVPNNVLAPFWTDLNPDFGGRVLVNTLTDGTDSWTVVEWESVRSFGDVETTTAQIWLGSAADANPGEDISFVYGADVSDGDGGFLTVGVENSFGSAGGTVYFDGVGAPPAPSFPIGTYEVDVISTPGTPGETTVIEFDATGRIRGDWVNWAEVTSPNIAGTAITGFPGRVL